MPKVWRNMGTPEGRAFWKASARAAEVESWPAWRRAGINVAEPLHMPKRKRAAALKVK